MGWKKSPTRKYIKKIQVWTMKMRCWPVSGSTWIPPATPLPCALAVLFSAAVVDKVAGSSRVWGFRWRPLALGFRDEHLKETLVLGNFILNLKEQDESSLVWCEILFPPFWCFLLPKSPDSCTIFVANSQVFFTGTVLNCSTMMAKKLQVFGITYAWNTPHFWLWFLPKMTPL